MNRATPNKLSRTQRIDRSSPYARPAADREAERKVKRSSSLISFPGLRSLVSYMTYPFSRSPTSKGLPLSTLDVVTQETKSESGSEDQWEGDGPNPSLPIGGQLRTGEEDVFAKSTGKEDQAEQWKRRGEIEGGRRDTARRSLAAPSAEAPLKSPVMPGHLSATSPLSPGYKATPSMPAVTTSVPIFGQPVSSSTTLKRRLSPTKPHRSLPPRAPLPTFHTPHNQTPVLPLPPAPGHHSAALVHTSASSLALKTFLDAKNGEALSSEDLRVIESLTESARHESEAGSVRGQSTQYGGWVAGSFTPRPIKPLPSSTSIHATPTRQGGSAAGTPVPAFSLGVTPPRSSPWQNGSPGQVQYIGPGWSARRIQGQPRKSGLRPLFDPQADSTAEDGDDGTPRKRRKDDGDGSGLGASKSMPDLGRNTTVLTSHAAPPIPTQHPTAERQKPSAPVSPRDPIATGKQRAANIMLDLINSELGLTAENKPKDPVVVNPYHPDAFPLPNGHGGVSAYKSIPQTPGTQVSSSGGTPRRSILKQSAQRSTPLRGVAKKMEEAMARSSGEGPATPGQQRRMTTMEMLMGPSTAAEKGKGKETGRSVRIETPGAEADSMEVDDLVGEVDSPSIRPAAVVDKGKDSAQGTRPKEDAKLRTKMILDEVVKPLPAPQLFGTPSPLTHTTAKSKAVDSMFTFAPAYAGAEGLAPLPAATFTPSPLSKPSQTDDTPSFSLGAADTLGKEPAAKPAAVDFGKIYLSAKETALAIAKEALPFFAFTLPSTGTTIDVAAHQDAKEEAKNRPLGEYTFSLDKQADSSAPGPAPTAPFSLAGFGKPAGVPATWTCDTCMLQSPQSALEKCVVCEAPRPANTLPNKPVSAPAPAPSPTTPFSLASFSKSASAGSTGTPTTWTCDTCMLQNPQSALEKCTVCEAPRPAKTLPSGSAPAPTSTTAGSVTAVGGGFNWAAAGMAPPPAKKEGVWKCSVCNCESPEGAVKCVVCETPR